MVNQHNPALRVGLACLLLLWSASCNPAQAGKTSQTIAGATGQTSQTVAGATGQTSQTVAGAVGLAAPLITTRLLVNGTVAACGAVVPSGAQVCLLFTSNQTGIAVVFTQKGRAVSTLASGSVRAGITYRVCVIAGAADGLTRIFTITVANTAGESSFQQCPFLVAPVAAAMGTAVPTIRTSLRVNGLAAACGAVVSSGARVCLRFTSDQSGTAVLFIRKGSAISTLARGAVRAGITYSICVIAGAADGLTRIFTVTVANGSGLSTSQQCSFLVAPVAAAMGTAAPIISTRLLVNGTVAACGRGVASGAQVCLLFIPDQSGTAVVRLQKGTAITTLALGPVRAGITYRVCVIAGAADGLTRTFTVTLTNTAGQPSFRQCSYVVP